MQERYWKLLQQLRADAIYFREYAASIERHDSWLTIYVAVISGGSVSAIYFLKQYTGLWTFLVCASQIASVIRQHRPLRKKVSAIHALSLDLEDLALDAEHHWFDVSQGNLSESEINALITKFRQKQQVCDRKRVGDTPLPTSARVRTRADKLTEDHFRLVFNAFPIQSS